MKSLKPLIRLNRWKVDEKSRALGVLLQEAQRIQKLDDELTASLTSEKEIASATPEGAAAFANYVQQVIRRRQQLAGELERLERKIGEAREELRLAMGEAKKIEVAEDNRQTRAADEEKARETQVLDDIALTGFRRKEE
jgi:flagellar export protein FliJ